MFCNTHLTHRAVSCNSHGFSRKCDCVDFVPSPCYNMINRRCLFLFLFEDQNLWRNRLHRRRLTLFARAHNPDTLRGNAFGKPPLGRTNACLRTWRSGEGGGVTVNASASTSVFTFRLTPDTIAADKASCVVPLLRESLLADCSHRMLSCSYIDTCLCCILFDEP